MKQSMSNTLSPFDAKIHRMGRLSTVIVWVFFQYPEYEAPRRPQRHEYYGM